MARILDFCILQAERELQEALFLAEILLQERCIYRKLEFLPYTGAAYKCVRFSKRLMSSSREWMPSFA